MKKFLYFITALLFTASIAHAINITVPSAPGPDYFLTSTGTNAYVAVPTSTARTKIGFTGGNKITISATGTIGVTTNSISQWLNDAGYVTSTGGGTGSFNATGSPGQVHIFTGTSTGKGFPEFTYGTSTFLLTISSTIISGDINTQSFFAGDVVLSNASILGFGDSGTGLQGDNTAGSETFFFTTGGNAQLTIQTSTAYFTGPLGVKTATHTLGLNLIDGLFSEQEWGSGPTLSTINAGNGDESVFIWYPALGSLIAAEIETPLLITDIGGASANFGENNRTQGYGSAAFGHLNNAYGQNSLAIGDNNDAWGENSFVGGSGSYATGSGQGFAWGNAAVASTAGTAIALGVEANALNNGSVVIGGDANDVFAAYSSIFGGDVNVIKETAGVANMHGIILGGASNLVQAEFGTILGGANTIVGDAVARNSYATAIGSNLTVLRPKQIVIGNGVENGLATSSNYQGVTTGSIVLVGSSTIPSVIVFPSTTSTVPGNVSIGTTTQLGRLFVNGTTTSPCFSNNGTTCITTGGATTFLANGVDFVVTSTINFQEGTNVTITTSTDGTYTISSTGGAGGGVATSSDGVFTDGNLAYFLDGMTITGTSSLKVNSTTGMFEVYGTASSTQFRSPSSTFVTSTLTSLIIGGDTIKDFTGTGLFMSGNTLTNSGVLSLNGVTGTMLLAAAGQGLSYATSGQTGTFTWANPGYITAASGSTFTAANIFVATTTFQSSTLITFATGTILSTNASGSIGATTVNSPLGFSSGVLSFTNPGYVTFASSGTWTAGQTWTGGATFNSTSTHNSSTIFNALITFNSTSTHNSSTVFNGSTEFNNTSTFNSSTVIASNNLIDAQGNKYSTSSAAGTLTGNGTTTWIPIYNTATGFLSTANLSFTTSTNTFVASGTIRTVAITATTSITVAGSAVSTSTGSNPSVSIGLAAVNGSANTFLRSDGAPSLSQSIIPTWTALHTFNGSINVGSTSTFNGTPQQSTSSDFIQFGPAASQNGNASGTFFGGNFLNTTNFDLLHFQINSSTMLKVASTGNFTIDGGTFFADVVNNRVGVGTSTPQNLFTVATGTKTLFSVTANGSSTFQPVASGSAQFRINDGSGNMILQIDSLTTASNTFSVVNPSSSILDFGVATTGMMLTPGTTTALAIGGSALTTGSCTSTTAVVNYALVTSTDWVNATPQTYPGDGVYWRAYISAVGVNTSTITAKVCASTSTTPTATKFNLQWGRNIGN